MDSEKKEGTATFLALREADLAENLEMVSPVGRLQRVKQVQVQTFRNLAAVAQAAQAELQVSQEPQADMTL
jgi:hypothetical protein